MANDDYKEDPTELAQKPAKRIRTPDPEGVPPGLDSGERPTIPQAAIEEGSIETDPVVAVPTARNYEADKTELVRDASSEARDYDADATERRKASPRPVGQVPSGPRAFHEDSTEPVRAAEGEFSSAPTEQPPVGLGMRAGPPQDATVMASLPQEALSAPQGPMAFPAVNAANPAASGLIAASHASHPMDTGPRAALSAPAAPLGLSRANFALLVAGAACFLSALALLWVQLSMWGSPVVPLGAALALALLASGGAVALTGDRSAGLRSLVASGLIPAAIAASATLMLGLVWQVPHFRALLRPLAGDGAHVWRRVLSDPSSTVLEAECVRLAPKFGNGDVRGLLFPALIGESEVVEGCLESLAPTDADAFSGSLASAWLSSASEVTSAAPDACAAAQSLAALQRPGREIETRLLACVLGGTETGQQCCLEALEARVGAEAEAAGAQSPGKPSLPLLDAQATKQLVSLAFHGSGLTPPQEKLRMSKLLELEFLQRYALDEGCASIERGATELATHLAVSAQRCGLRTELPETAEFWAIACELKPARAAKGQSGGLCAAADAAAVRVGIKKTANTPAPTSPAPTQPPETAPPVEAPGGEAKSDGKRRSRSGY